MQDVSDSNLQWPISPAFLDSSSFSPPDRSPECGSVEKGIPTMKSAAIKLKKLRSKQGLSHTQGLWNQ